MSEKFSWVVITNQRAAREFDFLVQRVGEEKLFEARGLLGLRKAFPLNLARVLRVKLPDHLQYLPAIEAQEKIRELRRRLVGEGGGVGVQREGRGAGLVPDPPHHSGVPGGEDGHA